MSVHSVRKYRKLVAAKDLNCLMTRYYAKGKVVSKLCCGLVDQWNSGGNPHRHGHRLGLSRER